MKDRFNNTSGVQIEYRGGCGAHTYINSHIKPSEIPEESYILNKGQKLDFPGDPRKVIPSNKELKNTPFTEITKYLTETIPLFVDRVLETNNLKELKKITGESEDLIHYDAEIAKALVSKEYMNGIMQMSDTNLIDHMDSWKKHDSGYSLKAVPLGKGVNINPGHNIGAVLVPEIWRVLSKNSVLHKMPTSDQFTLKLLSEVYEENPSPISKSFKASYWPGGSGELEKNLFSEDYVMAWGDDSTIKSIQEKVAPTTRFLPFHFEFGAYLVDKEIQRKYDSDLLKNISTDFSWGDQLLCFSPLIMAIEETENTPKFLKDLSTVLEGYEKKYALGSIPKSEKMKLTREKRMRRAYGELISDFGNKTTVILKDNLSDSDLEGFHNFRFVEAHKVNSLEDAIDVLGKSDNLQEFILATNKERGDHLRDKIIDTKAKRIVSPGGAAPRFPTTWDGKHPINNLIRWVTDERVQS